MQRLYQIVSFRARRERTRFQNTGGLTSGARTGIMLKTCRSGEMADATDLKSVGGNTIEGSTPSSGTISSKPQHSPREIRTYLPSRICGHPIANMRLRHASCRGQRLPAQLVADHAPFHRRKHPPKPHQPYRRRIHRIHRGPQPPGDRLFLPGRRQRPVAECLPGETGGSP